jgi:hypothetical protein
VNIQLQLDWFGLYSPFNKEFVISLIRKVKRKMPPENFIDRAISNSLIFTKKWGDNGGWSPFCNN